MPWFALGSAFWLGILTAISPCPLAANIAAISFVGRQVGNRRRVLGAGLLYTLGRVVAYAGLGALVTGGLLASAEVSRFLQTTLSELLGPVLILVGMALLGILGAAVSVNLAGNSVQQRMARGGVFSALPLGILLALSFCPVSAALFFGALIPLSLTCNSWFLLPVVYGGGTALPVVFFAFLIAFASEYLGRAFDRLGQMEVWVRRAAGVLFILAGVYYCLTAIFGLNLTG